MKTIFKILNFPQDICEYIGYLYYQECLSNEQCYQYHTNIIRKDYLNQLIQIHFIFPKNISVHTMIRKTLYEHDFKSILPRYYLHADPFQIYLCGSVGLSNKISLKYKIKKMNRILKGENYINYRKLTSKAISEGYYTKDLRNIYWKIN